MQYFVLESEILHDLSFTKKNVNMNAFTIKVLFYPKPNYAKFVCDIHPLKYCTEFSQH